MNLLCSLTTKPEVLWALLALLSGGVLWLGYQLAVLRRGMASLRKALQEDTLPLLQDMPREMAVDQLQGLARLIMDTVAESDLQRASAEGYQQIQKVLLDHVGAALFIVDESQEIRFANRGSREMFPGNNAMIGQQLIEVCLDRHFGETVASVLKNKEVVERQIQIANDSRTFQMVSGSIDASYGIGVGAWIIIRDISEEFHTEQIRKDFVANASHEFRTPLSIINGYLEMMEDDPGRKKVVQIMMKHTERLSRIVDEMLLISRLESGDGSELESKALFDIGNCVSGMIDQLQPIIEKQGARVKVEMPKKSKERQLYGDRFYWDQIFFNLIENALKQNPNPGLKISIWIMSKSDDGPLKIEVVDNGVGIPAADIGQIFKRFYRVDKSHSQKTRGTGLGLSIVKRAVEAHHGTIEVTSQPGIRTAFTILLPNSRREPETPAS